MLTFRLAALLALARRSVCGAADAAMAKGRFFYAVRKGLQPGVYATW